MQIMNDRLPKMAKTLCALMLFAAADGLTAAPPAWP